MPCCSAMVNMGVNPYSLLIRARLTELRLVLLVATRLFRIRLVALTESTCTTSGYGAAPETTSSYLVERGVK